MHLSTHPTNYPTRYQEIAARLEQELRQHYRCGDYLPAEHQLTARFEVNRRTLRRTINQSAKRGWVQRRQGVGALVLMRPFDYPLSAQARFSQNLLDQDSYSTSEELLAALRPASSHIADAFSMNEGDDVIHLRTLRRVNGVALCQIDHYFSDLSLWSLLQDFSSGSLHDYLREQSGLTLLRTQTRINARRAQAKENKVLEIPNMAPLLYVHTLSHREDEGHAAEYSVSLTRADMIELTMEHRIHFDTAAHQRWMCALAYSNADILNARITALKLTLNYKLICAPESGLMQIQTRMGDTGNRFFTGDTTLTCAVARLRSGALDYSCLLGRNKQHTEQCMVIDALLQEQTHFQNLMETLIAPLETEHDALINTRRVEVNTSQVDFFTLARGDNA